MGIPFDPEAKYKGRNGEDMGVPMKPNYMKVEMEESLVDKK
jgi:hypothetical protein